MSITITTELEEHTCPVCGILYALPPFWFQKQVKERGGNFYCPAGHTLTTGKGELEKAREELAKQKSLRDQSEAAAQSAANERAKAEAELTRIKRRVAGGKCVCCKKNFTNMRRHMTHMHPDYAKGKT